MTNVRKSMSVSDALVSVLTCLSLVSVVVQTFVLSTFPWEALLFGTSGLMYGLLRVFRQAWCRYILYVYLHLPLVLFVTKLIPGIRTSCDDIESILCSSLAPTILLVGSHFPEIADAYVPVSVGTQVLNTSLSYLLLVFGYVLLRNDITESSSAAANEYAAVLVCDGIFRFILGILKHHNHQRVQCLSHQATVISIIIHYIKNALIAWSEMARAVVDTEAETMSLERMRAQMSAANQFIVALLKARSNTSESSKNTTECFRVPAQIVTPAGVVAVAQSAATVVINSCDLAIAMSIANDNMERYSAGGDAICAWFDAGRLHVSYSNVYVPGRTNRRADSTGFGLDTLHKYATMRGSRYLKVVLTDTGTCDGTCDDDDELPRFTVALSVPYSAAQNWSTSRAVIVPMTRVVVDPPVCMPNGVVVDDQAMVARITVRDMGRSTPADMAGWTAIVPSQPIPDRKEFLERIVAALRPRTNNIRQPPILLLDENLGRYHSGERALGSDLVADLCVRCPYACIVLHTASTSDHECRQYNRRGIEHIVDKGACNKVERVKYIYAQFVSKRSR